MTLVTEVLAAWSAVSVVVGLGTGRAIAVAEARARTDVRRNHARRGR